MGCMSSDLYQKVRELQVSDPSPSLTSKHFSTSCRAFANSSRLLSYQREKIMKGLSRLASLLVVLQILPNTAFQVSPEGNSNQPPSTPRTSGLVDDELINIGSTSSLSFQCTQATSSNGEDFQSALQDLFQDWEVPTSPAIGYLFVSPAFSSHLKDIVELAQQLLGQETQLLTVVGGGVIGGGCEKEDSCSLSFLGGILPEESSVSLFSLTDNDSSVSVTALTSPESPQCGVGREREPSHLIFADPYCKQMHELLKQVDGIVAGGISVAGQKQSSLAIGTEVLPPGSLIGATFTGNIGLQVVVSQGCRPVGPTYRVTSVSGPAIHELDSERAIDQLQETMDAAKKESTLPIKDTDFLGGVHNGQRNSNESDQKAPHEFILRQMTGFRPRSGSILVCGPQIQAGDFFRFHVQSKEIALKDWQTTLKSAETERLFLGGQAGTALGALQISCMGRGSGLFGTPNVDLRHVERLLPPDTPIAGLLANAEIGPVGIRMGTSETCKSVLHGFASVVAMLCDYSETKEQQISMASCLDASSTDGSWE